MTFKDTVKSLFSPLPKEEPPKPINTQIIPIKSKVNQFNTLIKNLNITNEEDQNKLSYLLIGFYEYLQHFKYNNIESLAKINDANLVRTINKWISKNINNHEELQQLIESNNKSHTPLKKVKKKIMSDTKELLENLDIQYNQ